MLGMPVYVRIPWSSGSHFAVQRKRPVDSKDNGLGPAITELLTPHWDHLLLDFLFSEVI